MRELKDIHNLVMDNIKSNHLKDILMCDDILYGCYRQNGELIRMNFSISCVLKNKSVAETNDINYGLLFPDFVYYGHCGNYNMNGICYNKIDCAYFDQIYEHCTVIIPQNYNVVLKSWYMKPGKIVFKIEMYISLDYEITATICCIFKSIFVYNKKISSQDYQN
jgi:hypothetical protein